MAERRSVVREYFEAILIAGIFLGFTNTFLIKTFYIPSGSMEETLLVGDHLFVNRFIYGTAATELERRLLPLREVQRGDVVIFRSPESPSTDLVKRGIGLPGDEIRLVEKHLFVNGQEVDDDSYTIHRDRRVFPNRNYLVRRDRLRDSFGPYKVPEGETFFLGDNRDESYDSRYWGSVPRHFIKGRAVLVYWSFGGETPNGEWSTWSDKLRQIFRTAAGFFTQTRWQRTFHPIR